MALNRDECRPTMQWAAQKNAGFTMPEAKPWLPIHPLHKLINVDAEQGLRGSLLHAYKRLLALRKKHPALHSGSLTLHREGAHCNFLLGYERRTDGEALNFLGNFSSKAQRVRIPNSENPRLLFSTHLDEDRAIEADYTLRPFEAIVTTAR